MKKFGRVVVILLSVFVFFGSPTSLLAAVPAPPSTTNCDPTQPNVKLSECYLLNSQTGTLVSTRFSKPTDLVNLLVRNAFIVAGILIFFTLLLAGFQFQTGGAKSKDKALETIKTALIGLVVMLAAYWIVQIVRVVTGADINL
jgi:hypothetical protein